MKTSELPAGTSDGGGGQTTVACTDHVWGPYPSPASEVRFLLRAVGRNGDTLESLRRSIVTDEEEEALLRSFAAEDSECGGEIGGILDFRRRVLIEFDRLACGPAGGIRGGPPSGPQRQSTKSETRCTGCGKLFKPMTEKQWRSAYQIHLSVSLRHTPH